MAGHIAAMLIRTLAPRSNGWASGLDLVVRWQCRSIATKDAGHGEIEANASRYGSIGCAFARSAYLLFGVEGARQIEESTMAA